MYLFIILYKFYKQKVLSALSLNIRNYEKNNAFNIRCFVSESFPATSKPAYYIVDFWILNELVSLSTLKMLNYLSVSHETKKPGITF